MDRNTKIALTAAFAILVTWVLTPVIVQYWLTNEVGSVAKSDIAVYGQFGDLFGSINSLFSGLGFVGLVYAVLLQREDLKLQSTALFHTEAEIARQNAQMERTTAALEKQARLMELNVRYALLSAQLTAAQQDVTEYEDAEKKGVRELKQRPIAVLIGRAKTLRREVRKQLKHIRRELSLINGASNDAESAA